MISILVPIGIKAIDEAKTLTVANNLSQISIAVISKFYLNHKAVTNINNLSSYFGDQAKILDKYALNTIEKSTNTTVNIWYTGGYASASATEKYLVSIVSTGNNVPQINVEKILVRNRSLNLPLTRLKIVYYIIKYVNIRI